MFTSVYIHVHVPGISPYGRMEPQHVTCHDGLREPPVVITDGAPGAIEVDLYRPLIFGAYSAIGDQPDWILEGEIRGMCCVCVCVCV